MSMVGASEVQIKAPLRIQLMVPLTSTPLRRAAIINLSYHRPQLPLLITIEQLEDILI